MGRMGTWGVSALLRSTRWIWISNIEQGVKNVEGRTFTHSLFITPCSIFDILFSRRTAEIPLASWRRLCQRWSFSDLPSLLDDQDHAADCAKYTTAFSSSHNMRDASFLRRLDRACPDTLGGSTCKTCRSSTNRPNGHDTCSVVASSTKTISQQRNDSYTWIGAIAEIKRWPTDGVIDTRWIANPTSTWASSASQIPNRVLSPTRPAQIPI